MKLLEKAIKSFLNTKLKVRLYLVDNSPTDSLKYLLALDNRIEYIFNNYNLVDDVIEIFRPIVDYVVYMNLGLRNEFCKDYRQELLKVI